MTFAARHALCWSTLVLLVVHCDASAPPARTPAPDVASTPVGGGGTRVQPEMTPTASAAGDLVAKADPTVTDPDNYHAAMENEHTRVLRYHDVPGTKTHQHHHPDSVLYALSAFRRRLLFPDGTSKEREFKPGDVMWIPAQTHAGENIGDTDTEVLLIEFKTK